MEGCIGVVEIVYVCMGSIGVICSILVIVSECLQQGVLWLIAAYISVSICMVYKDMGVIGLLLIIIYVGAIAVVLLFIVMLVDSGMSAGKIMGEGYIGGYVVVGCVVGIMVIGGMGIRGGEEIGELLRVVIIKGSAIEALGEVMYSSGVYMVLIGAIVLLVAMVGAIDIIGVEFIEKRGKRAV